jgi:hypothetical protein
MLAFDRGNGQREAEDRRSSRRRGSSSHDSRLKRFALGADISSMDASRKSLALALGLAVLALSALTGCASDVPAGSAAAQAGIVGEFYEQIESESDETETRERAVLQEGDPQALEPGQRQIEAGQSKREMEAEQEQEWG